MFICMVPRDQPPDPPDHEACEHLCQHNRTKGVGREARVGEDVFKSASLTHSPNVQPVQNGLCFVLNEARKRSRSRPSWSESLLMLFCLAKVSEAGAWGAPVMGTTAAASPGGIKHPAPLQENTLRHLWAVPYAMVGSSLPKAMTLFLYFSCPQPYKHMFALNKAAGRHLLCLWLRRQDRSDVTWMPKRHNRAAIALTDVSWCTSSWGPAASLRHYFFKTSTEMENVY